MTDANVGTSRVPRRKTLMNTRPRLRATHRALMADRKAEEKLRRQTEREMSRGVRKVDAALEGCADR